MSEWRSRVPHVPWRYVKNVSAMSPTGDVYYSIEARVGPNEWVTIGSVAMDVAGEGWGLEVAQEIVNRHNAEYSES